MLEQTGGCEAGLGMFEPTGGVGQTKEGRRGFAI